jgi:hypothetical protein
MSGMTYRKGEYLMWFTRYGSVVPEHHETLDDCIELAVLLDDCDTSTFDSHGCSQAVERIGYGLVSDFDERVDEAIKLKEARWAAAAERRKSEQAIKKGPLFTVSLKKPESMGAKHLSSFPTAIAHGLTNDEVIAERDRLEELFGADRVVVRQEATRPNAGSY